MAQNDTTRERGTDDAQADDYSGTTTVLLNGYAVEVAGVHADEERSRAWTREGYETVEETRLTLVSPQIDEDDLQRILDEAEGAGHSATVAPRTGDPFAANRLHVVGQSDERLVLEQRDEDSEPPFPRQDYDLPEEGDRIRLSFLDTNTDESAVVGDVERSDGLGHAAATVEVRATEGQEEGALFTLDHYDDCPSMVRGFGPALNVEVLNDEDA